MTGSTLSRRLLFPMLLGGCSVLPAQPYLERREWLLDPRRPTQAPRPPHGPILLVRSVTAGPGLSQRGLRTIKADGSLGVDFYEEWAVPPAQSVEEAMRHWLGASGLFSAVLPSGSRTDPDLILESELIALVVDTRDRTARAALAVDLLNNRSSGAKVTGQDVMTATEPVSGDSPVAYVSAMQTAVASVLTRTEAWLSPRVRR